MSGGFSLIYSLTDAFKNIRGNPVITVLSSLTVGFSLSIFVFFLIVLVNLNSAVNTWGERSIVSAYIKDEALREGVEGLKKEIEAVSGVREVIFVSKQGALSSLKAGLKGFEGILEGVEADILPASFEIRIDPSYINPDGIKSIVSRLKKMERLEDVEYGAEWVERFSALLKFIEIFALVIGVFLAAATLFIISNTIRLTVFARKDEIEVLRYLGGSDVFVKMPFFIEGMMAGAGGGLIAFGIILLGRYILSIHVPAHFLFIIADPFSLPFLLGILILSGLFFGGIGSIVSLARFLKA